VTFAGALPASTVVVMSTPARLAMPGPQAVSISVVAPDRHHGR
jgi:hypothetical protein